MTTQPSQSARDAAADYFTVKAGPTLEAECMREGNADHWPLVQAFARFEASIRREVREECARVAERSGRHLVGSGDGATYAVGSAVNAAQAIRALSEKGEDAK